jgi:DNA-binding NtrC family response regulator
MSATVLIVRRYDDLLWAIRDVVALDGWEVRTAAGVEGAIDSVARYGSVDVLVVDEDSVGADWYSRLAGIARWVPRILMTWDRRAKSKYPCEVTVLMEPFSIRELREALAEALRWAGAGPTGRARR